MLLIIATVIPAIPTLQEVNCFSVAQSCPTLCNPMDCIMPGHLVPHHCPSLDPLHQWCHPAISSSDALFSFCSKSSPASGTYPVSWLLASGDGNTGASASASVLPIKFQGWFPLRLTGLISSLSKGLSGVFSSTTFQRHQLSGALPSYSSALTTICDHWEDHSLDYIDFNGRVMSLLFNTLSRFVTDFLPRSNHLLISWLQSLYVVILEPKKRKSVTTFTFSPSICHEIMGLDAMNFDF